MSALEMPALRPFQLQPKAPSQMAASSHRSRPSSGQLLASLTTFAQKAGNKLYSKTDSILQGVTKERASKSSKPRQPRRPAYLEPCYKWLLNNLHNPYPSHEQREAFSREAGSSMKVIAAWFISARQRIGWSQLRATHFGRSQTGIVEAASRFWPERNTQNPLPPDLELRFAEIEANAVGLYADVFTPSAAMLASLKRRQQPSNSPAPTAGPSHSAKRTADDAGLNTSSQRLPKKTRSTSSEHRSVRFAIPVPMKRQASLPISLEGSQKAADLPPTYITPQPPRPKFGEPSMAPPPVSRNSLKRPADREETNSEERTKRPRVLPTWPDPRKIVKSSNALTSSTSPARHASSSSSSARPSRRDHRRRISDPQPSTILQFTAQSTPLEGASTRSSSLPPLSDATSDIQPPMALWPPPPSPPPQLVSTPSTDLSTELPTPQSDMAFLTMDDASCTWAIDGVSQFDVSAVPDPNSLDMTLGDPFLQGNPYFELPATFADIDWDALLSQPPPCEPQPLAWEPQPLRCESQPLPCEPLTTAQWDIYGTSTEPAYCGQDTFAPTYGEELPLGQFLTGFTNDLVAPEPITATA